LLFSQVKKSLLKRALLQFHHQQPQGLFGEDVVSEQWLKEEAWAVKKMLEYIRMKEYRPIDFSRLPLAPMLTCLVVCLLGRRSGELKVLLEAWRAARAAEAKAADKACARTDAAVCVEADRDQARKESQDCTQLLEFCLPDVCLEHLPGKLLRANGSCERWGTTRRK